MTRRGAALVLLTLVPVALGGVSAPLLAAGLALFVASVAAVVADSRRAPGGDALRVERTHDDILSVGRPNEVRLRITSHARAGTRATVRDEHPAAMRASRELFDVTLPCDVTYTLTPAARTEVPFGATIVRASGPWGLGFRQTSFTGADDVARADADIAAVRVYEALARRGQLAELGVRTQRRPGEGTEFERIREAVPDDPMRLINWRATARTGRLMAVELIPERAQPVIVCIDHGRLMGVGAGALTKLDHAVNAALLLINVALRTGDRAGMMAFADRVTVTLPPRSGRAQVRRFLDTMRGLGPAEVESDYDDAFTFLSRWQRRRALVVIFTDVLDPDQAASLVEQCARLRRTHFPLVVTVRDPAVVDAASATPVDAASMYARAVASTMTADREETLRLLRARGVDTLDADARTLSPRLVNRYLELKRHSRV